MQLDTATAYGTCIRAAKAASKAATRGPWATQPDSMTSVTAATSSAPSHGCMTLMRVMSAAPDSARPAATASRCGCHQATSSRSPSSRPVVGLPAEVLLGGRDIGEPAGDAVDGAVGAVLDVQVRVHGAQQGLGEAEQRGLLAAGDVVDALADVAKRMARMLDRAMSTV